MTDSESEERWEVYPGQVADEFAMFAVNLAPHPDAPFDNLRWLNIVRLGFEPLASGMPSEEMNDLLYEVEDILSDRAGTRGGIQVGRLTVQGRRELFFYSATNDAELVLSELQEEFGEVLNVDTIGQLDAEWSVYFEFLYPKPLDFQRIHNQHVARLLAEHGDDCSISRQIDHVAFFADEANRRTFAREIVEQGFSIEQQSESDDGELRFQLSFTSVGTTDLATIDRLTVPLFVRIGELGGAYDGWGCPVMGDDED
jgi:uncharacterized protein (TIGR01619 family)